MNRKSIALQIAEHFGYDIADIRDYDYQPGHWSQAVYAGFDRNNYWSAGRKAPHHRDGDDGIVWTSVPSNYPGNANLWKGASAEQATDGVEYCQLCEQRLTPDRIVWLEMSFSRGYAKAGVIPKAESQGLFPYGSDCAPRMLQMSPYRPANSNK